MENYTRPPISEQWGQSQPPTYYQPQWGQSQPPTYYQPQQMQQPPFYVQMPVEKKKGKSPTIAALVCSTCALASLFFAIIVAIVEANGGSSFFLFISMCLEATVMILLIVTVARGK